MSLSMCVYKCIYLVCMYVCIVFLHVCLSICVQFQVLSILFLGSLWHKTVTVWGPQTTPGPWERSQGGHITTLWGLKMARKTQTESLTQSHSKQEISLSWVLPNSFWEKPRTSMAAKPKAPISLLIPCWGFRKISEFLASINVEIIPNNLKE